jgi:hypothetical protein
VKLQVVAVVPGAPNAESSAAPGISLDGFISLCLPGRGTTRDYWLPVRDIRAAGFASHLIVKGASCHRLAGNVRSNRRP